MSTLSHWFDSVEDLIFKEGTCTFSKIGINRPKPRGEKRKISKLLGLAAARARFKVQDSEVSLINPNARPKVPRPKSAGGAVGNAINNNTLARGDQNQRQISRLFDVHDPSNRYQLEKSKGKLELEYPVSFQGQVFRIGEVSNRSVNIFNNSEAQKRSLANVVVYSTSPGVITVDSNFVRNAPILPGGSRQVTFRVSPRAVGRCNALIAFQFGGFVIGRFVEIHCGDPTLYEQVKPSSPYKPRRRRKRNKKELRTYVAAPPTSTSRSSVRSTAGGRKLDYYDVPGEWHEKYPPSIVDDLVALRSALRNHAAAAAERPAAADIRALLHTYREHFRSLLWTEEMQQEIDIQQYDQENVGLHNAGQSLRLEVPGLAEKRPSVLLGDAILITRTSTTDPQRYEGVVTEVGASSVLIRGHTNLHHSYVDNEPCRVEFKLPRRTFRLMQQGLELLLHSSGLPSSLLFPRIADIATTSSAHSNSYQNHLLNEPQIQAVRFASAAARAASSHPPAPYIIFGPPGTGKTRTLVAMVRELLKLMPSNERILVTAPSNTAADVLVERMSEFASKSDMLRIMAYQVNRNDVSRKVDGYCHYDTIERAYTLPALETLNGYRIIVTTCMMAGKLYNHGVAQGSFRAVVVDEAGQAWEPELLAAVAWVLSRQNGLLVLAGDPRQLGPITQSDAAAEHGLGVSMLERLLDECEIYQRDLTRFGETGGYDARCITKLRHCYRCHPEIIRVPNELFYDGDLIDSTDLEARSLQSWEHLPARKFPVIFHGIDGENTRESSSPSWFNVAEVEQVLHYVQLLRDTTRIPLKEVGIIAPYRKQVKKLEIALSARGFQDVTVGSCEQFQGKERTVIIISTVRSAKDLMGYDARFNLGFVSNPKRMNVAITRAKALLIVVGCTQVLWTDPNWRRLIEHCRDHNAYTGVPLPKEQSEAEVAEIDRELSALMEMHELRYLEAIHPHPNDSSIVSTGRDVSYEGTLLKYHVTELTNSFRAYSKLQNYAMDLGAELHAKIDCHFNREAVNEEETIDFQQFKQFCTEILDTQKIKTYRTEWTVVDPENSLSGTVDFVGQKEDGTFLIIDWKRTNDVNLVKSPRSRIEPSQRRNQTLEKYSMQLSMYRHILQKEMYRFSVSELWLVLFHPELPSGTYQIIPVEIQHDDAVIENEIQSRLLALDMGTIYN